MPRRLIFVVSCFAPEDPVAVIFFWLSVSVLKKLQQVHHSGIPVIRVVFAVYHGRHIILHAPYHRPVCQFVYGYRLLPVKKMAIAHQSGGILIFPHRRYCSLTLTPAKGRITAGNDIRYAGKSPPALTGKFFEQVFLFTSGFMLPCFYKPGLQNILNRKPKASVSINIYFWGWHFTCVCCRWVLGAGSWLTTAQNVTHRKENEITTGRSKKKSRYFIKTLFFILQEEK